MNALSVVTMYIGIVNAPLYCGGTYDLGDAWLALPVEEYLSGRARCGDEFAVYTEGELMILPARDAGLFGDHCVMQTDGSCADIVADLPRHIFQWRGTSHTARVFNLSALKRKAIRYGLSR